VEIILKYFSDFTKQQLKQLASLERLYKEWNGKINVISRKDIGGLYEKHVLHSLSIAAVFDFADGTEIIDIGTGGGFPGIPLAIFFPNARFHLVDSIAKKLKVVEAIAASIGLNNITTQNIRAEEIKGRKFDFAVSRAVAPLKELWQWSKPLLKNPKSDPEASGRNPKSDSIEHPIQNRVFGSGLICLKGGDLSGEISESGTKPRVIEIFKIFQEQFFREKYILYLPRVFPELPLGDGGASPLSGIGKS
jgi:16S rRNA (guanine527-N7)-methyltransferase